MERRLTTIIAADMVGYSRLMAADEEGTLTRLQAARKDVVDPEIRKSGGRIVKTMGDGLLIEFPSPVEAMRAVITIQRTMATREADRSEDQRIVFRVGVNLGDVIIDGEDIMGDGVNIAARLEGLAEPGGIVVSGSILEQVKGKVDCGFVDLGPQKVKNIPAPVDVHAVALDGIATTASPRRKKPMLAALATVLVIAAIVGGYLFMSRPTDALANLPEVVLNPKAGSLIVLPFQDYSEDKSLDYFADGMTEDLITDLSRWKEFRVIARNTSMTYKDKPVDVREVARETNTRYVLEGSVRRIGDQMRVTAQLIDGQTGSHVWAERFEETGSDILAMQDSVIRTIVQSLKGSQGAIREDEYAKTWAKAAANLEEYDYYLRGHAIFFRFTPEAMAQAVDIWKSGLEKYPNSGLLKVKLGMAYYLSTSFGFPENQHPYEVALALGLEGMADPNLPPAGHRYGLWLLANVNSLLGKHDAVLQAADQAAKSYPFDSYGMLVLASSLVRVGEYDLADQLVVRGLKLGVKPDPGGQATIGRLRYAQKDCKRAEKRFQRAVMGPVPTMMRAGCAAEEGDFDKANALLKRAREQFAISSTDDFPAVFANMPGVTERLTAQLAKVGWPE